MSGQGSEKKLLRGTTDFRNFEDLAASKSGFLALTGKQIKQNFPQFEEYPTYAVNQALTNVRRRHKEKYQADKKVRDQEEEIDEIEVEESEEEEIKTKSK